MGVSPVSVGGGIVVGDDDLLSGSVRYINSLILSVGWRCAFGGLPVFPSRRAATSQIIEGLPEKDSGFCKHS